MAALAEQNTLELGAISVNDHAAFAAKHMSDLGHTVADFQVSTWKLKNWRTLQKKLTGSPFPCGGHTWRVLLYPFGNSNAPPNDAVSVYLECIEPPNAPKGWHACAQFAIVMSNPHDPKNFVVSFAHHRFEAMEADWGFTRFHDIRKLFSPGEGGKSPIIMNDETTITVFVRVLVDPTGVLWHNFMNYDSKVQTGYTGLKNLGATGYLSVVLQTLYCNRAFRKAVYQIPTEEGTSSRDISRALQRVFYDLQTSDQAVSPSELTRSFGWTSLDSFMQHDALEFNQVLQEKLKAEMKGTASEGATTRLFVGKMRSYIKCVNVDYELSRVEDFDDIQLEVKGMKDLAASFKDYIAVDSLEGENKYMTPDHGLQDAKKGVIFESFPDVLYIQLKRYTYDIQKDAMVKITDRHEFPFDIDLGPYLSDTADRSVSHLYRLHGVIVHSGGLSGGQYFAHLKPDRQSRWLKFDDDRVTPVTDKEVLDDNYGGDGPSNGIVPVAQRNQARLTSAYILVYIRDSALGTVLAPLTEADIPAHIKQRVENEKIQQEAKKKEREEQRLYLNTKVISDKSFAQYQGLDLANFDAKNPSPSDFTERVLKSETYLTFKGRVAKHFGIPEQHIRLWVLVNRQNKTVRPDIFVPENAPTLTMEQVWSNMAARSADLRLYLDVWEPSPIKPMAPFSDALGHNIMIFLKHFDVRKQTLLGISKVYVSRTSKVSELQHVICEKMRWTPQPPIKLYEEIKPGMIELMNVNSTFTNSQIQDGDIICFQSEITRKEILEFEQKGLCLTPIQFYESLKKSQPV